MNGRERVLAVLEGREPDTLPFMPITMMFAADLIGRPYGVYATDYRVLVEGQLRVAELFSTDHVSCISDPAREAADCGARIMYFDDQPPAIDESAALLADKSRLVSLTPPDPLGGGRMFDRVQAVALFREKTGRTLLIEGWVEGPMALSADLRGINTVMLDFFDDPNFTRDLMAFCADLAIAFARAQLEAGADIIGIGDAAASLIGPEFYASFVLPEEKRIIDAIHGLGGKVRLHICGNTTPLLPYFRSLAADMIDLDSMVSMKVARDTLGPSQVLAGNIEPVKGLCDGSPDQIRQYMVDTVQACAPAYIMTAGCEVVRTTPNRNLHAMRDGGRAAFRAQL
ncbi:MAG TPA: uroporphyrinogen decarboxylase family protein [Candidatus Hydrogenedentes bacterium]|nr:uroporphyrinogen decarboxylase family protein [Candidatus Hydrogenedentota bacterium]